ncbi:glycosyltransferase [Planococcus sp. CP5-4]|uniref:glycosyltransferase n=1 Tax=unclassified Planococcus (in: firmicutes) TaxID=2662419 RepID=UPI001C217046|nr:MULTISPECIES: glycosyltransferase [unclassified Planococcus (in: firmicutes)]MBU9675092.1 glycosyltransferase [Planococcus sp. CP5-4_YE]MBV0908051.1 glycosyltransferase [Planococcus sp. CP5-4_UN]MBW6062112.1 glycosyltransferase [Planococcus sp. CP5-4]
MKILQINSVCGVGSTGRIATDIHDILQEHGHESWIAYGRGEAKNCENTIKIGNKLDNYTHVAKTRLLDQHGFGSKKATLEFLEKVKKLDPDVIHLHNIHGYYINIELLFSYLKKAKKKVIWTLHDCWAFTGHCAYFDFRECNCWKIEGDNKCIQSRSYPSSWLLNNSKENFQRKKAAFSGIEDLTIVTPSNWLAELVKKSFLKNYTVNVVNNGIDLGVFKPTESNFKLKYKLENKFTLLGVASIWDERKGLEYFLKLSKMISTNEYIILIGLTEKQQKNLPLNIIGIDKTNNIEQLAEIYSAADVFVNPTLEDNFPTTNIEALACGTPVVTFNTGGSIESIDESCGKVVDKGDSVKLFKSIKEAKELKRTACRQRSLKYEKKTQYKKYLEIYIGELDEKY